MAIRKNAIRNIRNHTARTAWKVTEKAAVGLARWGTTDNTNSAKWISKMPAMGFIDTVTMILATAAMTILGAVVTGVSAYVLIAYGIPFLLGM